jgi:CRISPR system Cascade subunit CasC
MTIDVDQLTENLPGEDIVAAAISIIDAFLSSYPSGKQNTFANRTLPDTVLVSGGTGTPVNLIEGFRGQEQWDSAAASAAMLARWTAVQKMQHTPADGAVLSLVPLDTTVPQAGNLTDLLDRATAILKGLA